MKKKMRIGALCTCIIVILSGFIYYNIKSDANDRKEKVENTKTATTIKENETNEADAINKNEKENTEETEAEEVAEIVEEAQSTEEVITIEESVPEVMAEEYYAPVEDTYSENEYTQSTNNYAGTYQITAYTWTGNAMANGEYPYVGCAASCDFPIGTVININGIGTYTIADVCPTSGVIDIYMNTYDECINFGRQYADVYIQ
ncbi:3D domain-containing protein [Mediterraneibacter sp. NSJ-55]|uniref:3D domain-containing protein n=1 Tax=Mediterraneibacter hominis TaxID=2763054 RepID=A0A923LGV5_9FIRM|nr:3D domain-containing protein [Mediterraneibacter hominis]MBC5688073.1 3D domain-containing protein [Mediterraneibacter hominis]